MNQQEISIRKNMSIVLPEPVSGEKCTSNFLLTLNANLQSFGFTFSKELFEQLHNYSKEQISSLYEELHTALLEMIGGNKVYNPMYPNFPQQVMEASDEELYSNAMMHYWGFLVSDLIGDASFVVLPSYAKKTRPSLTEIPELKVLNSSDLNKFRTIFTQLVSANSSISESDKQILSWFIENQFEYVKSALENVELIPQKETLAYLAGSLPDPSIVSRLLKTATDVLRVAVVMSGGDVSLAIPCKFKTFSKKQRRFFLQSLENCGSSLTEDMIRWDGRWIRLGEKLHPGDYKSRFPKAFAAFDVIRNNNDFVTFNGRVESAIKNKNISEAVSLLKERGGSFARRLDHLLRVASTKQEKLEVICEFGGVVDTVSTPVLLQVYNHFKKGNSGESRTFFPKGSMCKIFTSDKKVQKIGKSYCSDLVEIIYAALVSRFSKSLPPLGSVYLDKGLKNYFVPFALRSASKSMRTLTRGSRIDLPSGDCVRLFLWWKNNGAERIDIDLSALLLDEKWDLVEQVAFYNLRGNNHMVVHSGDITSAPNGACEFIDVDLNKKHKSARYLVMVLNSYTGTPYCDLPECFAGWMMRTGQKSGEVFEAKTVQNKVDLTSNSTGSVPLVFDLQERKVIWMDIPTDRTTLYSSAKSITTITKAIAELNRPNLYDLFFLHVKGRGKLVKSPKNADLVIGENGTITPYDLDKIMSEFMA